MFRSCLRMIALATSSVLLIGSIALAAGLNCDVCGMDIPEKSRNRIEAKAEGKALHICSLSCLKKARKQNAAYQFEFADFNKPETFVSGEKAFFLMKSQKITKDLGDMVMPPYFGAFRKKTEADAQAAKYGDGVVVQGLENALK